MQNPVDWIANNAIQSKTQKEMDWEAPFLKYGRNRSTILLRILKIFFSTTRTTPVANKMYFITFVLTFNY